MSEAKYWEEYDAAKKAALKMAAKLSAKEKGLMVRALHCDMKDEAEHDQTRQRAFEQSMLSLDHPDEDGNLYDYGDCGRAAKRMFREMDEEIASNCIFVDKGVLNRSNDSSVAIIGDTDARLTFDDPTKVHKVIVMHGARVFIVARNYAVVKLVNIGDDNKVFVNKDNTAVILK